MLLRGSHGNIKLLETSELTKKLNIGNRCDELFLLANHSQRQGTGRREGNGGPAEMHRSPKATAHCLGRVLHGQTGGGYNKQLMPSCCVYSLSPIYPNPGAAGTWCPASEKRWISLNLYGCPLQCVSQNIIDVRYSVRNRPVLIFLRSRYGNPREKGVQWSDNKALCVCVGRKLNWIEARIPFWNSRLRIGTVQNSIFGTAVNGIFASLRLCFRPTQTQRALRVWNPKKRLWWTLEPKLESQLVIGDRESNLYYTS